MAHKINGSLRVIGQVLDLKPEVLAADPTAEVLGNQPRIWAREGGVLKFFTGSEVIDFTLGEKVGYTLEKSLNANGQVVTNLAAPVSGTDAARKIDIDNALSGLDFQADVLGMENTGYDPLAIVAGRYIFEDGSKFSGALAAGAAAGDIVVIDGTGAITSVAYDVSAMGAGALTWSGAHDRFMRWDGATWAEFGGLTSLVAGAALFKDGNTLRVVYNNTLLVDANGNLGVDTTKFVDSTEYQNTLETLVTETELAAFDYQSGTQVDSKISTATANFQTATQVSDAIAADNAGSDYQADVLGLESGFVSGTSAAGRYIFVDGTVFTGAVAAGAAANDIVVVDAAGAITSVAYDVSVKGAGAQAYVASANVFQTYNGTSWAAPVKASDLDAYVTDTELTAFDYQSGTAVDGKISTATANFVASAEIDTRINTATTGLATTESVTAVDDKVAALTTRIEASYFDFAPATAGTVITVTHNFGNMYPIVQVVDTDNTVVGVEEIKFVDANTLTVTLAVAAAPRVIVQGLKAVATAV